VTEPTITLKSFFDQAREGRLTAIRCGKCGALAIPPKEFCESCQQRAWSPVTLTGEGTVASYTIIRVAPARHAAEAPYVIAVVKMKEGVSLLGRVVDVPLDRVAIGLRVKFRPLVSDGKTALGFGPA
jgi:uncharacterized OB-fold protein